MTTRIATISPKASVGVQGKSGPSDKVGTHLKKENLEAYSMNEQEARIYIQSCSNALETALREYATPAEITALIRLITQNIQQSPSVVTTTNSGALYDKKAINLCMQHAVLNFIQYVTYTKVLAHTGNEEHAKSTALSMRNNALTHIRINGGLNPETLIPTLYCALP
jgi:hypothetical protein